MRDEPSYVRPAREPIFNLPVVILASLAAVVGIHAVMEMLASLESFGVVLRFGFVPALWTVWLDPGAAADVLRHAAEGEGASGSMRLALTEFVLSEVPTRPWTLLTYGVLHGSWMHVVLNALWLAAFGTPVARRCGSGRFLVLAAMATLGGALAHWASNPMDAIPMIGASAAVSGMMAAAARFVFTPTAPGDYMTEPHLRRRQSLPELLGNRRALMFVGVWFAINLIFGLAAVPLGIADGGIAWEAHIGGFLVGLLLFPLLDPAGRPPEEVRSRDA